eukprot:m.274596 g.274596  ORF g.274596 m.274596 type:complete len:1143 (+) comp11091_c1_seq12:635-4063(+)
MELVACGRAADDTYVLIVHPESCQVLPPNTVGELWVSSPSVSIGYHDLPDLTQRNLKAVLAKNSKASDSPVDRATFLRTGDLGFLDDGDVFVCGRLKNILIIGGKNHYPQDIEASCQESTPHLRPGCAVAFSVPDPQTDEELVVVVAEVRDLGCPRKEIVKAVCKAVARHHGLHCHDVVLIPPRKLPKTTSGKPRHRYTRELYMIKKLESVFSLHDDMHLHKPLESTWIHQRAATTHNKPNSDSTNDDDAAARLEARLLEAMRQSLDLASDPAMEDSLDALGMSSMQQVELTAKLSSILGHELAPDVLMSTGTIRNLLDALLTDSGTIATPRIFARCDESSMRPRLLSHSDESAVTLPLVVVGVLQLLGLVLICLVLGASVLPSYYFLRFVFQDLSDPWASLPVWRDAQAFGLLVPLAFPLFMTTLSIAVILVKWLLIGRYREGRRKLHSLYFVRWWVVDRLVAFWEQYVGMFIGNTVLLTVFYKLCGARIAWTASIKAANLRDFDLLVIESFASVDGTILARELSASDGLVFAQTRIQQSAIVRVNSFVGAGCTIENHARLLAGTVLAPFSTAAAHTVYEGNPGYVVTANASWDETTTTTATATSASGDTGADGGPDAAAVDATTIDVGHGARHVDGGDSNNKASDTRQDDQPDFHRSHAAVGNAIHRRIALEVCKALGLLATLYVFFLVTMCTATVFWEAIGTIEFRYMALLYWVVTYLIAGVCATVLGVLFKWLLLGRVRPGLYSPSVLYDAAVFVVGLHQRTAYFLLLRWLSRTTILQWWMRAYGVRIGRACTFAIICTVPAAQADLFEFEDGVFVSAAWFMAEDTDRSDGRRERTRVLVKSGAEVGVNCIIGPNAVLGEDCIVGIETTVRHEHVAPGSVRLGSTTQFKTTEIRPGAQAIESKPAVTNVLALLLLALHTVALVPAYELAAAVLFEPSSFWNGESGSYLAQASTAIPRSVAVILVGLCVLAVIAGFGVMQLLHQAVFWGVRGAVSPHWFWHYPLYQGMSHARHSQLMFLLHGSVLYTLYLQALGARVALSAVIFARIPVEINLLQIGAGATVDEGARVIGHVYTSAFGGLFFDRVHVESRASVMPFATVWPGTRALADETVAAHQVAPRDLSKSPDRTTGGTSYQEALA